MHLLSSYDSLRSSSFKHRLVIQPIFSQEKKSWGNVAFASILIKYETLDYWQLNSVWNFSAASLLISRDQKIKLLITSNRICWAHRAVFNCIWVSKKNWCCIHYGLNKPIMITHHAFPRALQRLQAIRVSIYWFTALFVGFFFMIGYSDYFGIDLHTLNSKPLYLL